MARCAAAPHVFRPEIDQPTPLASPDQCPCIGILFPLPRNGVRVYPRRVLSAPIHSPIDSPLAAVKNPAKDHAQARVEEPLRSGEPNFEHIVDNIPGLVFTTTPNGALEFVNRRVLEYFGRTLAELRQWATSDSIHPDGVPSVLAARKRVIEAGESSEGPAHRLRRADGTYRWFTGRTSPVRDGDDRIVRWYSPISKIASAPRSC